jgi:multiple sugar transport system substrate-binding protein
MKKILSSVLTCALMLTLLASCNHSGDNKTSQEAGKVSNNSESIESSENANTGKAGDKTIIDVWSEDRHDQEYVEKMVAE